MEIRLDHVGWVTNDIKRFEDFWVKGLGFDLEWESWISYEKTKVLFGKPRSVLARRYRRGDVVIEIHVFTDTTCVEGAENQPPFERFGINHISLHVENRERFLQELLPKVEYLEVRRYYDPSGWYNIFIRDFDGNWIELRETL